MLKTAQKIFAALLMCIAYIALPACGTKGPLYIPEQRYPDGVPKDNNKGVENDATKKDSLEANISAPPSPAQ